MIRLIVLNDIPAIMVLISNVIADMKNKGIDQWDEVYPDGKKIKDDAVSGCAYGFYVNETWAGYVVVNQSQSPEYQGINWQGDSSGAWVIHRLCVAPQFQGQGIAKEMMTFAEEHTKKNGGQSLRLDAFSKNPTALALYEKLEYIRRGTVVFRKGQFVCFEKVFNDDQCGGQ